MISFRFFAAVTSIVFLGVMLAACDNPVDPGDDEHAEAEGLVLTVDGTIAYRVLSGVVSCEQEPCSITVGAGEESEAIQITFLDEDGEPIHDEDLEEENLRLAHELADAGIATFVSDPEDEWQFRIRGVASGSTRLRLSLLHNEQHDDFSTPPLQDERAIIVRVTG